MSAYLLGIDVGTQSSKGPLLRVDGRAAAYHAVEVGVVPRRLVAVGGGSQSALWTQIVSDVTGRTIECVERPIGPALADAFLAGYGIGLFRDFAPLAERWIRIGRRVSPDPRATAIYDGYYRVYRRLYERTVEEMHELARLAASPTD